MKLVGRLVRLLQEATEEADRVQRQEALTVFRALWHTAKRVVEDGEDPATVPGVTAFKEKPVPGTDWKVIMDVRRLPQRFPYPLVVSFVQIEPGYESDVSGMFLPVHDQTNVPVIMVAHRYFQEKAFERTFVHEFIHYLDMLRTRGKNMIWTHPADRAGQAGGRKGYTSNPLEFNSHYQEHAAKVLRMFHDLPVPEAKRIVARIRKDPGAFYRIFREVADFDPDKEMRPAYARRYKKRLYGLYKALIDRPAEYIASWPTEAGP